MFNSNRKTKNILLNSATGVFEQVINYGSGFLYRSVFLSILSKTYLGVSGLFSNVLQVFSLAELGVGAVIAYRMYAPIKDKDIHKCAQLLEFYRKIYRYISFVVLLLGVSFLPFLNYIIKDPGEIPADINIAFIYVLYVFQNVCSYFFVYYQSLLSADQKGYVISAANTACLATSYLVRSLLLIITRNFTAVLSFGILFNIVYNFFFGQYIKQKYKEITNIKVDKLSKEERREIFKDTGALMCHKIGYTVVNSTDSILLSKYIGIGVVGLYSNYSLLTTAVDVMLNKIFGSFVPTIGNYLIGTSSAEVFMSYKRLRFVNFWAASLCAVCVYILIDPFIALWLGEEYLLDKTTTVIISTNIFLNSSRIINTSFVNAAGLFVKDKMRPLFQAVLNLAFSIYFVKTMGISGVFLGTILSTLLTVWWREGFILYKNIFKTDVREYLETNIIWFVVTLFVALLLKQITENLPPSWLGFIGKCAVCFVGINLIYATIFYKADGFIFFVDLLKSKAVLKKDKK